MLRELFGLAVLTMAATGAGVELSGSMITFHRRDGVVEGPFEFLAGNPRSL